jgi:A/G-specific adenine glycosylase
MRNKNAIAGFRRKLLKWYRAHCRQLPWRHNINPYRIWISEIMLQQTQTKTVIPYYKQFLKRFPDVESLAAATEDEVIHLWAGLGYYSRARNMRKAAQIIVDTHHSFPEDFNTILSLPGVGRYTAGAICSIAFNQPFPIVDGNIRRVLARLHGIAGKIPDKFFWETMAALVPGSNPSSFNQAMMELGALVCVPVQPKCGHCPLQAFCRAKEMGLEASIPIAHKIPTSRKVRIILIVLERNGEILIAAAGRGDLIPGSWGIPWRQLEEEDSAEETAASICRECIGKAIQLHLQGPVRHSITNNRITGVVYYGNLDAASSGRHAPSKSQFRWVDRAAAKTLLTSSLFHKALNLNSEVRS